MGRMAQLQVTFRLGIGTVYLLLSYMILWDEQQVIVTVFLTVALSLMPYSSVVFLMLGGGAGCCYLQ